MPLDFGIAADGGTAIMTDTLSPSGGQAGAPLTLTAGVWPLLGRSLLVVIGQILVIPSPWTTTSYYRWLVLNIRLPQDKQATFTGQPGDIWYIFMLSALFGYAGSVRFWLQLIIIPLTVLFYLVIMRWFFANLTWDGRTSGLTFTGRYWGLLGWSALTWLAAFTIIGWAWVLAAMIRWICRHVEGSSKQLSFVASGWDMLWRSFVFALSCIFIIPIPWTGRWYLAWLVSQFYLSDRASVT
jgi:hypothetical protein